MSLAFSAPRRSSSNRYYLSDLVACTKLWCEPCCRNRMYQVRSISSNNDQYTATKLKRFSLLVWIHASIYQVYYILCVFTLSRSFYPSTSSATRAKKGKKKLRQTRDATTINRNAIKGVGNATPMPSYWLRRAHHTQSSNLQIHQERWYMYVYHIWCISSCSCINCSSLQQCSPWSQDRLK